MSQAAAIAWWDKSLKETGLQGMEKLVSKDATWDALFASGEADVQRAEELTSFRCGPELVAVEIGCGVGRIANALSSRFGRVVGVDVAPSLIEAGRQNKRAENVSLELGDGSRLAPVAITQCDTVFAYEVLYLLPRPALRRYYSDAHELLNAGGELVFQMNLEPFTWKTRLSYRARDVMYAVGIKEFRGWPNGPGFRRCEHTRQGVLDDLKSAGFTNIRVIEGGRRQTWFVAKKD
jgi:SAM-dependent methyltransferase